MAPDPEPVRKTLDHNCGHVAVNEVFPVEIACFEGRTE
jgi:hypothetical protein